MTSSIRPSVTLVIGGARSGKSAFAESLVHARDSTNVLYVATLSIADDEMQARVFEHQRRRPTSWRTLEEPSRLGQAIEALEPIPELVVLEDLGLLVSNCLLDRAVADELMADAYERLDVAMQRELQALWEAQARGGWSLIAVSQEVGFGVVPPSPLGRAFRDALGRVNQAVAARADEVYLVVAGLPIQIKSTA